MSDVLPVVVGRDEGQAYWFVNSLTTIKATMESTGGRFSLAHQVFPPGFATPYHLHRTGDDAFYVLEGEVTLFSEAEKKVVRAGGYVFLPHGRAHGFRNDSGAPVTMLCWNLPGDEFVGFVREGGEPAAERVLPVASVPDRVKMTMLSERWGIEVLGPLPG